MNDLSAFSGPNAAYVLDLYDQYRRDPGAVDAATRAYFDAWNGAAPVVAPASVPVAPAPVAAPPARVAPEEAVRLAMGATNLMRTIRGYGHKAAHLDPLGSPPPGDPGLEPTAHQILEEELATLSPAVEVFER